MVIWLDNTLALVGRADVGVLGNYIIEAIKRSFPEKF